MSNQSVRKQCNIWLAICCFLVSSCVANSPENPAVGTDGKEDGSVAPNPLTYEQVDGVIKGLKQRLRDASGKVTAVDAIQNCVAYLKGQAVVDKVELQQRPTDKIPNSIMVRFKNGMSYVLAINNRGKTVRASRPTPLADTGTAPLATRQDALSDEDLDALSDGMTTNVLSGKAVLVDLDMDLPKVGERLAELLRKYGYKDGDLTYGGPTSQIIGKVDFFKTLHTYGFVYINGHGRYINSDGVNTFAVQTSEVRDPAKDELYWKRGDFLDNRVMLFDEVGYTSFVDLTELAVRDDPVYLVTAKFLNLYLEPFAKDSVVIFDTCYSALGYTGVGPNPGASLPATLKAKKVSMVYGWDERVTPEFSGYAVSYWFDRMLGDNKIAPSNPTHSPQSVHVAFEDLVAKKRVNDPSTNATLREFQANMYSDFLLRPSLEVIGFVSGDRKTVGLSGQFGNRGGEVCFGNACQSFSPGGDWSESSITAELSPFASGYVEVRVNGRPSNQLIINEWNGLLHYKTKRSKCNVEGLFHFRFRGGINPIKLNLYNDDLTYGAFTHLLERDSTLEYKVTGEWSDQYNKYECQGSGTSSGMDFFGSYARIILQPAILQTSHLSMGALYTQTIKQTEILTGKVTYTVDKPFPFTEKGITINSDLNVGVDGVIQSGNGSTADAEWFWDTVSPRYKISSGTN